MKKVNIKPGVNILSILSHINYQPWFAFAEFIDNSIQSYKEYEAELKEQDPRYKLSVKIEISPNDMGYIVIRDNAAGIHEKDYQRAFRAAELPPDKSGLSEFGMGMKSAACWFSPKWKVRTSALGEEVEREVSFDIKKIVEGSLDKLDIISKSIKKEHHFTEIILSDLHKFPKGRTLGKIKEHLIEIYRCFLRENKIDLYFNNELLVYEKPSILKVPYYKDLESEPKIWKKDIEFDFGEGLVASGFVAIRETGSTSKSGLSLFRRDRLIQGSGDEKFRPEKIFGSSNSFEYQRIFGEIFFEGFDVTHTKDGFQWGENEEIFLDILKEELTKEELPLIQQAKGYRAKLNSEKTKEKADGAVENTSNSVEKEVPPVVKKIEEKTPEEEDLSQALSEARRLSHKLIELKHEKEDWQILIELTEDPSVGNWFEVSDIPFPKKYKSQEKDYAKKIGLRFSLTHPFNKKFLSASASEIEPFLRIAVAFGLAEILARSSGVKMAGTVRMNFNELIKALSN